MITLYLISNNKNEKKYVGQTIQTLEQRFRRHCWSSTLKSNNTAISGAILKYGKENFEIKQIDTAISLEEANRKEVYWAEFYNCFSPNGYNLKAGGRIYVKLSEETKLKIKLGNLGKKASPETIKKLSESHKGFKVSEETKKKLSSINKGKKPHKNTIQAIKEKSCKKYILISPSNEEILVINMKEFCIKNKLYPSNMCLVVKGKIESYKGWRLKQDLGYVRDYVGSRRNPLYP